MDLEPRVTTPSSSRPIWNREPDKVLLWEPSLSGMKCDTIEMFDESVVELEQRLYATMGAYEGIGLAAPQVGIFKRAFVVSYEGLNRFMVNPKIAGYSGWTHQKEGCLSSPGASAKGNRIGNPAFVRRYETVVIEYRDKTGEEKREEFKGYTARVMLHELDHCHGRFFFEHCSSIQREIVLRNLDNFKHYYARKAAM
jgi:peptide deformylase